VRDKDVRGWRLDFGVAGQETGVDKRIAGYGSGHGCKGTRGERQVGWNTRAEKFDAIQKKSSTQESHTFHRKLQAGCEDEGSRDEGRM
jgi:hypothetical protein